MKEINLLIIVPTLNSYKLLNELIKSLKKQTFKNWKLLFIDGGSDFKHIEFLKENSNKDKRISWVKQKKEYKGIYGAMNQGILYSRKNDWVLFWGSDDKAASKNSLHWICETIKKKNKSKPYLLVSNGRYFNNDTFITSRDSFFLNNKITKIINNKYFAFLLFVGYSPPHQGTIFSPEALLDKKIFDENYDIAADIKYFLRLSSKKEAKICCLNKITVLIGNGGFSSIYPRRKIQQVLKAYYLRFGFLSLIPFLLRYFRKLMTLFKL